MSTFEDGSNHASQSCVPKEENIQRTTFYQDDPGLGLDDDTQLDFSGVKTTEGDHVDGGKRKEEREGRSQGHGQDREMDFLMMAAGDPVTIRSREQGEMVDVEQSNGASKEQSVALSQTVGDTEEDVRDGKESKRGIGFQLKKKVLHFTPSWFSVCMGTGVQATLLLLLGQIWGTSQYSHYFEQFIRWPALCFLLGDVAIFIVFTASFIARYIMFPQVLPLTIKHPQKSFFLGTYPMALITIVSAISQLGTTSFELGIWPTMISVGLWFLAVAISAIIATGVIWSVITYQTSHRFHQTTAVFLLPVVPPITAAATASVLTEALTPNYPTLAFTIMTIGYMNLGIGLPLALMILVLYLQRLILFKAPPREIIVSVFLPLGPCGQGGEAALHLGRAALPLFPIISRPASTGVPKLTFDVGETFYGAGLISALLLWALGMWWAVVGTVTFLREWKRGHLKFNMGWWSFTFPVASLTIVTGRLAQELDSLTLKIIYTAFTLLNFCLWLFVAIPTVKGFFDGSLLIAPCIADLPLDPLRRK